MFDDGPSGERHLYGARLSAVKQSGNWFYYLADGLGSTVAVVDADGDVVNSLPMGRVKTIMMNILSSLLNPQAVR